MAKHILIITFIAALAGGGYWISKRNEMPQSSESPAPASSPTSTQTPEPTSTSTPTIKKTTAPKPKTSTTPKPSSLQAVETYQEALKIYSTSGFRFQFSNCQASPGSLIMKIGAKFMLDNRDAVTRAIGVGTKTYNIGAYGFTVATAPSQTGTHYITCNGGGTATISVQP